MYTVNASNASAALAASGAGGEIKEAIQAGMEVTFHERGINAHGWSGTGYSIVDPETGVGSYLIEGKGNGSYFLGLYLGLAIVSFIMAMIAAPLGIMSLIFMAMFIGFIVDLEIVLVAMAKSKQGLDRKCFFGGFFHGVSPLSLLSFPVKGLWQAAGAIFSSLGLIDAVWDLSGTREGCMQ